MYEGVFEAVDCKGCKTSFEATKRREEYEAKSKIEFEKWKADREESQLVWWAAYEQYLQSDIWKAKRHIVLMRCHGICEGCAKHGATQVHHLRYPHDCLPGSSEWIQREKLFHLVGVCDQCHEDLHPGKDEIND